MSVREFIRVRNFALMMDVPERTVYDAIAKGRVPSYRVSPRSIRIDMEEALAALRDERPAPGEAACGDCGTRRRPACACGDGP